MNVLFSAAVSCWFFPRSESGDWSICSSDSDSKQKCSKCHMTLRNLDLMDKRHITNKAELFVCDREQILNDLNIDMYFAIV